jgi:RHS repeat-associated protein
VYQGTEQGTPLLVRQTCYNNFAPPCSGETSANMPTAPSGTGIVTNVYNSYNGGSEDRTTTDYLTGLFVPIEVDEYNFGATTPLRKTLTQYLSLNGYATVKLTSVTVQNGSGNQFSQTTYGYDQTALTSTSQYDVPQHSSVGSARGNLTSVSRWNNVTNSSLTTKNQYDDTGNLLQTTDPLGNVTTYSYLDSWNNTKCALTSGRDTLAFRTAITNALNQSSRASYNSCAGTIASSTDANMEVTKYTYDNMARTVQTNYPDGGQTSVCFTDEGGPNCTEAAPPLQIVTSTLISSAVMKSGTTSFDGYGRVTKDALTSDPDGTAYKVTVYDSDGRVGTIYNPTRCSTPTVNCGETTWGYSTYTYDAMGRTTKVAHSDGTSATTSYTGRATSVQDEGNGTAPVQRITQVDGLGRLISVCEVTSSTQLGPGPTPAACGQDIAGTGFLTTYSYDALDNLLAVIQGSLGQRTFAYDSLSRLLCAANPETGTATCPNPDTGGYTAGTTGYAYDADGNLISRIRPAPNQTSASTTVTTTYAYDAVNRLTQKSYSDTVPTYTNGTPTVMYGYDQTSITMGSQNFSISNSIGRLSWAAPLTQASYTITMKAFSYDPMGRVQQLWQHTPAQGTSNVAIAYGYDKIGDELDFFIGNSVPGSTEYVSTYNSAGRLTSFTTPTYNDATNPSNLLTNAHYDPFGHLVAATFANGLSQSWAYDNRGRPHAMAVGTTCSAGTCSGSTVYSYGVGYTGDSDVLSATDSVNGTWSYTYDGFNRVTTSNCTANCPDNSSTQGFSYGYDRYGNRWNQTVTAGMGGQSILTFDGPGNVPNNHIDGYSYDAAGNLLNDTFHNYKYDAENRLISVDNGGTTYIYDADGQRVEKNTGGALSDYNYDREGRVLIYNNPASSTMSETYAAGLHLGTYVLNSAKTDTIFYYNHSDWLGTERARTNLSGSACETITSLPFGDGQTMSGTCVDISPMHFTGKERDSESNLDNFGARYNASSMGRFMTPDPSNLSVDFWIPQTWNRYSYVLNGPLAMVDRNGLWPTWIHDDMIKDAFPGLSKEQIGILQDASAAVDQDQSAFGAYKHGMSNGLANCGFGCADADDVPAPDRTADFIQNNEDMAQSAQAAWIATGHSGLSPDALRYFGNALHTIQDMTSPMHRGFQPWYGPWWRSLPNAVRAAVHLSGELSPSGLERAWAMRDARNAFRKVFATAAAFDALNALAPIEVVTHKIIVNPPPPPPPQTPQLEDEEDR